MKSSNRNVEIATEILRQLGGRNKLNVMLGLKDILAVENGLSFKIKYRGAKANHVQIVLNTMDMYDITFNNIRGMNVKEYKKVEGIYCDQLVSILEETLEIYLSL